MVISANHFKDVTNGYERRTDGLYVHRGKMSVGPPGSVQVGVAGDLNVSRGDGAGVIYFGGFGSNYVLFDGTKFVFAPPLTGAAIADGSIGTADLAPGAASALIGSYNAPATFSSSQANVWLATPVSSGSVACSGAPCRVEISTIVYHSVAAGGWYAGLMVDGVVAYNMSYSISPTAGYSVSFSWTVFYTPTAGNHTFTLTLHSASAGTLTINPNLSSALYVTEQRR